MLEFDVSLRSASAKKGDIAGTRERKHAKTKETELRPMTPGYVFEFLVLWYQVWEMMILNASAIDLVR